jgi:hypothetical protein
MSSDADDRLKKWLEGEEEDDATMELSIADVFALKQQDARNKAAAAEAKATKHEEAPRPETPRAATPVPEKTTPELPSLNSDMLFEADDVLGELDDIIAQSFTDETSTPSLDNSGVMLGLGDKDPSSLAEDTDPSDISAGPDMHPPTIPVSEFPESDPLQDELLELDNLLESGAFDNSIIETAEHDMVSPQHLDEIVVDASDTSITSLDALDSIPELDPVQLMEESDDDEHQNTNDAATSVVAVGTLAGLSFDFSDKGDANDEPTSEIRISDLEELDDLEDLDDPWEDLSEHTSEGEDSEPQANSSTSVVKPTAELLAASREWASQWDKVDDIQEDATGHFEIPAALIQESKQKSLHDASQVSSDDPRVTSPISREEMEQLAVESSTGTEEQDPEYTSELSMPHIPALTLEAMAVVDDEGRLVLPREIVSLGPLRPGMKVKLRIDVIE